MAQKWNTPPKRPCEIQRDVEALNRSRKVSQVLSGCAFKDELENILRAQTARPKNPSMLLKKSQEGPVTSAGVLEAAAATPLAPPVHAGELIVPINDLRGSSSTKYRISERHLRCKLASMCRLADMFGWSSLIHNLVTALYSTERDVLANPFGLLCYEVTASSLVRMTCTGAIADYGSTQFGVDHDDLSLHLSLYANNQSLKCIVPVQSVASIAVSCMSCGLLTISKQAILLEDAISYFDQKEDDITLNPTSKVMFMHGRGLLAFGQNIEEAFHYAYNAAKACEIQVSAIARGIDGLLRSNFGVRSRPIDFQCQFEGLMRMLDHKGYNTGYEYKCWEFFQPQTDSGYAARKAARDLQRAKKAQAESMSSEGRKPNVTSLPFGLDGGASPKKSKPYEVTLGIAPHRKADSNRLPPGPGVSSPSLDFTNGISFHNEYPADSYAADKPHLLDRVTHTAKHVADSTQQAVDKLLSPTTLAWNSLKLPSFFSLVPGSVNTSSPAADMDSHSHSNSYHKSSSQLCRKPAINKHNSAAKAASVAKVVAQNTAHAVQQLSGSSKTSRRMGNSSFS